MIIETNNTLCENVNRISLSLLHFGYAAVDKKWSGKAVNPDFSRLYYVAAGEAEIKAQNGQKFFLKSGTWILLPADFSFDYACRGKMEHFYFHLKLNDLDGLDMLASFTFPTILEQKEEDLAFFFDCLHNGDLYAGLSLRQRLEAILFTMQKEAGVVLENNRLSPCVVRAIKYIRRHLSAQLTLAEIAENSFVSKSTLTKHFRNELSKSVAEYVSDLIMFEAGQRLLKTNLSVLAVSEKYGFSDQFYFSRRFKQKFGCSPQKYRKTALT